MNAQYANGGSRHLLPSDDDQSPPPTSRDKTATSRTSKSTSPTKNRATPAENENESSGDEYDEDLLTMTETDEEERRIEDPGAASGGRSSRSRLREAGERKRRRFPSSGESRVDKVRRATEETAAEKVCGTSVPDQRKSNTGEYHQCL
jgi:hypothetical protein